MCLKNKIVSIALGAVIALAGIFAIGNNIAQAEKLTATSTAGMNIEQMQQMIVKLQEQIAYIVQLLAKQKAICGNQVCETAKGETKNNCLADCKASPKCDNGRCEIGETPSTCPQDCFMGKNTSSCTNQCSSPDLKQCWGNGYQTCGNYDSDACLEWSAITDCPSGQTCNAGICAIITAGCNNECATDGLKQCWGNGYQTCGNYDSDACLEWSTVTNCDSENVCSNGACHARSLKHCNGNGYQFCQIYENDTCKQWSATVPCPSGQTCANGICFLCQPRTVSGCKVCNLAGDAWIDDDSKCLSGQKCTNGSCANLAPACTNDCSASGAKQCLGNSIQTCGNYDSDACLEWSTTNSCPSNQNCQNGNCVAICNANSYKSCYNGDVYWYDSCNVRGSLYDDCAINEICRSGACAVNSNLKANGAGCDSNSQCASGICKQGFPPGYSGFCAPPCTMCWPS